MKPKPPSGPPPDEDVAADDPAPPSACVYYLQCALVVNFVCGAGALFWPLFSMGWYGYGDQVYLDLSSDKVAGFFPALGGFSTAIVLALVLFDVGYWKGAMFWFGRFLTMVAVIGFALTALVCTRYFSGAAIAVYLIFSPALLFLIKAAVLQSMAPLDFFWWVAVALLIVAVVSGVTWVTWVVRDGNWWDTPLKRDYFVRLECTTGAALANLTDAQVSAALDAIELQGDCTAANLEWLSPLVLTVWCLLIGLMLYFAVRAEQIARLNKTRFDAATQLFITVLALGLMGMLASAEIAGAEIGVASDIFVFCMLGLIVTAAAVVFLSGGTQTMVNNIRQVPLAQRAIAMMHWDVARAALIIFFLPVFLCLLPLSALRQLGRKHLSFTKQLSEKERQFVFTSDVSLFIRRARRWRWAGILTRVIQLGFVFFLLSVFVARFFNVFFSWLNDAFETAGLGVYQVAGIFFLTGSLLMQLPPTPGMPIYLASSIIIVQVALRENWNFWAGWVFACFVAFMVRLVGFSGGQLQGMLLGQRSVTVRRLVGVNSLELRAIRFILLHPNPFHPPRTGIILGGPDWATAALAGMLKTSFFKNLLGNIPILLIVIPTSLTGAFWIRISEGGLWASMAAVSLAGTILVQLTAMLAAVHFIERTLRDHRAELEAYPVDQDVARLDKIGAEKAKIRRYVARWNFMPFWLRALMIWGAVFETISAYAFELAGSQCFVDFQITSSIDADLGGHVINLVKPMGWIAIAMCGMGLVVLFVFGRWVDFVIWARPDLRPKDTIEEGDEEEEEEDDGDALKEKAVVPNEMQLTSAVLAGGRV